MTIVADKARTGAMQGGKYNVVYQKGNDSPATPDPTWLNCIDYPDGALVTETHVTSRGEVVPWAAVDSSGDAWVPHAGTSSLASTPATWR